MGTFVYILVGLIVILALVSAVSVTITARKDGKPIPWDKVRPIALEAFKEVEELLVANKMGYKEVEDFVIAFILNRVDTAEHLNNAEKNILSEDLIRSIVSPGLKELHDKLDSSK